MQAGAAASICVVSVYQLDPASARDSLQSTGTTDMNGGLPVPESACAALNLLSPTPHIREGAQRGSRGHPALRPVNLPLR
ncbi:hypothetical protein SSAG_06697 [Streptomyces sp. Mg1]|nr:hypothetical protein SSAG_06697 [Streptomyces sp. Mg1]